MFEANRAAPMTGQVMRPAAEEVGVALVVLAAQAGPAADADNAHQVDEDDRRVDPADRQAAVDALCRRPFPWSFSETGIAIGRVGIRARPPPWAYTLRCAKA